MKTLKAKSTRKTDVTNPRQRSYRDGFTKGASVTEIKMLAVFSHYCKHNLGSEPKYGQNWKMILERHMEKHNL